MAVGIAAIAFGNLQFLQMSIVSYAGSRCRCSFRLTQLHAAATGPLKDRSNSGDPPPTPSTNSACSSGVKKIPMGSGP